MFRAPSIYTHVYKARVINLNFVSQHLNAPKCGIYMEKGLKIFWRGISPSQKCLRRLFPTSSLPKRNSGYTPSCLTQWVMAAQKTWASYVLWGCQNGACCASWSEVVNTYSNQGLIYFISYDRFLCLSLVFRVYAVFCFFVFGCQYQCNRLLGKKLVAEMTCYVVEWDVKPYTLTHSITWNNWPSAYTAARKDQLVNFIHPFYLLIKHLETCMLKYNRTGRTRHILCTNRGPQ